ncbi:MAG: histidine kinase [Propionibacteriaceae bacterium]|nr:histidine kinase [Propionibacteriaceae bacterium]
MKLLTSLRAEGATRNEWLLSFALAATGLVLFQVPFLAVLHLLIDSVTTGIWVVALILGFLAFLTMIFWRHYPEIFFYSLLVMILLQFVFLAFPMISLIIIPVAVFDVSRRKPSRRAQLCLTSAIILAILGPVLWLLAGTFAGSAFQTIIILIGLSVAGSAITAYALGRRGYDVEAARAQQVLAEIDAAEHQIAEEAARQLGIETQIRTDIARELHDIVAHSIAVMVVQAEGGLAAVKQSPDKAHEALATISETGREALQEMRRIVRTLRSESDEPPEISSAPGLADIEALVEKAQAELIVMGTPHGTTPTIEMTIYRVIQEALTNSLKHGGPGADPRVQVQWLPGHVRVTIMNNLTGDTPIDDYRGTGLIGMAERVEALEGSLRAGLTKAGGFKVCAQIPLIQEQQDRGKETLTRPAPRRPESLPIKEMEMETEEPIPSE